MVFEIPTDDKLKTMTPDELNKLAFSLTVGPSASPAEVRQSRQAQEWLSDALLRINGCDGVHSEQANTTRNRRLAATEIQFSQLKNIDWAAVAISQSAVKRLADQAAEAACTPLQQAVWILTEAGWSQQRIADHLHINQPAVSRALNRARTAMWNYVNKRSDAYIVFSMESHRTAYFDPSYRPPLDRDVEEARVIIEDDSISVSTHIQIDAIKVIEIWRRDNKQEGLTYRETKTRAKNITKSKNRM